MRPLELASGVVVAALLCGSAAAAGRIDGIWINPHGTVAVRTAPCGPLLCGRIVWASPKALAIRTAWRSRVA